jgi:hypothetical protein
MNTYMVTITMPDYKSAEFLRSIPVQRLHIDALMEKNTVTGYSLSSDRTKLWVTINAASVDSATNIVNEFPLRKFVAVEITELDFHNTPTIQLPALSMN